MINWVRPPNINFGMICLLVIAAPLTRGAVHPWATTLIQMFALTGVFLLIVGHFFSNPDAEIKTHESKNKDTDDQDLNVRDIKTNNSESRNIKTRKPRQHRHKKSNPQSLDKYILWAMALIAITSLDFPALMGVTFTVGSIYVLANTATDIMRRLVDPRIK